MLVVLEYPTWQALASNATSALDWATSQPADPSFKNKNHIRSVLATSQPGDPSLQGNIRSGIGPSQPGDPSLRGNIRSGIGPSQTVDPSFRGNIRSEMEPSQPGDTNSEAASAPRWNRRDLAISHPEPTSGSL